MSVLPGVRGQGVVPSGSVLVSRRPGAIEGFDALRACAALLVVAYHAGSLAGASSAGALAPVVAELKAGVAVFFVISGFLLYLPYARASRAGRALPAWRGFARRRAVRILPGYWIALTLLGASGIAGEVLSADWWRFFGLLQSYDRATFAKGLPVAWSLCVEIAFYALLPVFAWGIARLARARPASEAVRLQLAAIAALALGSLVLRALLARSLLLPISTDRTLLATSLPAMLDWFAIGLALAVFRAHWEAGSTLRPALEALARRPGRCWLAAAVLYLAGVPAQQGELFLAQYGVATHLAIGLAAGLFVLPAVLPRHPEQRALTVSLLGSPALSWLGTVSYGVYLWHVPFLHAVDRWSGYPRGALAFAGLLAVTLVGAVGLGAASWYLVERPAERRWGHRHRPPGGDGTFEGEPGCAQGAARHLPIRL